MFDLESLKEAAPFVTLCLIFLVSIAAGIFSGLDRARILNLNKTEPASMAHFNEYELHTIRKLRIDANAMLQEGQFTDYARLHRSVFEHPKIRDPDSCLVIRTVDKYELIAIEPAGLDESVGGDALLFTSDDAVRFMLTSLFILDQWEV